MVGDGLPLGKIIQMLAALFGSCGYRSAYYYDPYSYRDYSYSNSGS